MIRKATISLKNANKGKLEKLEIITKEYVRVVNLFIDIFWEQKQFMFKFAPQSDIDSWLSARIKQATAKQALSIIKSQRKRKKKYKPMLTRFAMELDSRFIEIGQDINSFDFWIKLSSIGDKIILNIPSRKHRQFNKLAKEGWKIKNSLRVRLNENGYFADVFFEKEAPVIKTAGMAKAVDIGYKKLLVSSDGEFIGDNSIYKKIARKKQGSNAFKKALVERNEIVNVSCKALNLDNIKALYAED